MISVITPSVRKDSLLIVDKCLRRQNIEYEWLVASPEDYGLGIWVKDPPKQDGDYYCLNKAWNKAFKQARGELIVSIQDGIWFEPNLLERFWQHYEANPKACVTAVGHQYKELQNGKPEIQVNRDSRARLDQGSFYEVGHMEMEFCVASFPKQAVIDCGGIDEEFDKFAALSEKEMMARIYKLGYTLWIDQTIEYRALYHPRLNPEWEERFKLGIEYFNKCMLEINIGKRLDLKLQKE